MRLYNITNNNDNINNYDRRVANVNIRLVINLIRAIKIY